jgi:hypothetical protein
MGNVLGQSASGIQASREGVIMSCFSAVKVRGAAFASIAVLAVLAAACGPAEPDDTDGTCSADELGVSRCVGDKIEVCQARQAPQTSVWVITQTCKDLEACYPPDKCSNGIACCK